MDIINKEYLHVGLELLSLVIVTLSFIKIRIGSAIASLLIGLIWYFSPSGNTTLTMLFGFSLSIMIVSNIFLYYLEFLSGINRASYKAKIENSTTISNLYYVFSRVLIGLGGFIGLVFVGLGLYYIYIGKIPEYIFGFQIIPLLVISFFGIREGFKVSKKIYYINYIFNNDLFYIMKDIKKLGLSVFLEGINNKDVKELENLNMPDFVFNRLRHRIPERKVFEYLDSVFDTKNNEMISEYEDYANSLIAINMFITNLNEIFGIYYHKEIFLYLKKGFKLDMDLGGDGNLYDTKLMYAVYLAHTASIYFQRNFINKNNNEKIDKK